MYEEEKGLRTPQTSSVKYIHSFRNFRQQTEEEGKGGYMFCFWRSVRVCSCGSGGYFSFLFLLILKEFRQPSENAPGMFIYSLLL
jgi:hypothetical protein